MSDWIACNDPSTGRTYWYHKETRETTWDQPAGSEEGTAAAAGEQSSDATQPPATTLGSSDEQQQQPPQAQPQQSEQQESQVVAADPSTAAATTTPQPAGVVGGGETQQDAAGEAQEQEAASQQAQQAQPGAAEVQTANDAKPAESPWKATVDPTSGNTYYYHAVTKETKWEMPDELKEQAGDQPEGNAAEGVEAMDTSADTAAVAAAAGTSLALTPSEVAALATKPAGGTVAVPAVGTTGAAVQGATANVNTDAMQSTMTGGQIGLTGTAAALTNAAAGIAGIGSGATLSGSGTNTAPAFGHQQQMMAPTQYGAGAGGYPGGYGAMQGYPGGVPMSTPGPESDNMMHQEDCMWRETYDEGSQKAYYYHAITKETRWDMPDEFKAARIAAGLPPTPASARKRPRRRSVKEMQECWERGDRKGLWKCPDCMKVLTTGSKKTHRESCSVYKHRLEAGKLDPANIAQLAPPGSQHIIEQGQHWRSHKDQNTGATYYYHAKTKETRWTKPVEMIDYESLVHQISSGAYSNGMPSPAGGAAGGAAATGAAALWKETIDQTTGKPYYFHTLTKETRWEKPEELKQAAAGLTDQSPSDTMTPGGAVGGIGGVGTDASNWHEAIDPTSGQKYYFNTITKESRWTNPNPTQPSPAAMPPNAHATSVKRKRESDWKETLDQSTGKPYYYHKKTKQTTWEKPQELKELEQATPVPVTPVQPASPWKQAVDQTTGRPYYYHTITKQTRWDTPEELTAAAQAASAAAASAEAAKQWKEAHDPSTGRTYWYHSVTKQTSWDKPVELEQQAPGISSGGWHQVHHPPTGRNYYYNTVTKESRWTKPDEMKTATTAQQPIGGAQPFDLKCPHCDTFVGASREHLDQHIRELHSHFKCAFAPCLQAFDTNERLEAHVREVHGFGVDQSAATTTQSVSASSTFSSASLNASDVAGSIGAGGTGHVTDVSFTSPISAAFSSPITSQIAASMSAPPTTSMYPMAAQMTHPQMSAGQSMLSTSQIMPPMGGGVGGVGVAGGGSDMMQNSYGMMSTQFSAPSMVMPVAGGGGMATGGAMMGTQAYPPQPLSLTATVITPGPTEPGVTQPQAVAPTTETVATDAVSEPVVEPTAEQPAVPEEQQPQPDVVAAVAGGEEQQPESIDADVVAGAPVPEGGENDEKVAEAATPQEDSVLASGSGTDAAEVPAAESEKMDTSDDVGTAVELVEPVPEDQATAGTAAVGDSSGAGEEDQVMKNVEQEEQQEEGGGGDQKMED